MKDNLLILIGAGATFGYSPCTKDITEHLLEWDSTCEKCINGHQKVKDVLVYNSIHELLTKLYSRAINEHTINFEELIHACDELASFLMPAAENPHSKYIPIMQAFLKKKETIKGWEDQFAFASLVFEALIELPNYVYNNLISPSTCPIVDGLRELSRHFNIKLFSLNYDTIPLLSGIPFETVFSGNYKDKHGEYKLFDSSFLYYAPHTYVNIHGSVHLSISRFYNKIKWYVQPGSAYSTNLELGGSNLQTQDKHIKYPTPVITGFRKADYIIDEPFRTFYQYFNYETDRCNNWLIVGYGAGDLHINAVLSSFAEKKRFDCNFNIMLSTFCNYAEYKTGSYNEIPIDSPPNSPLNVLDRCFHPIFGKLLMHPKNLRKINFNRLTTEINSLNKLCKWIQLSYNLEGHKWVFGEGIDEVIKYFKEGFSKYRFSNVSG